MTCTRCIVGIPARSTSTGGRKSSAGSHLSYPRVTLPLVGLFAFGLAGCGGASSARRGDRHPASACARDRCTLPLRTDLFALTIPAGSPTHWSAAGLSAAPQRTAYPNTPDRDLADDLRKQLGKNVLDPLRYEQDVWMPPQADQLARLLDAHFGTPAAPAVRIPDWNQVVATRQPAVRCGRRASALT